MSGKIAVAFSKENKTYIQTLPREEIVFRQTRNYLLPLVKLEKGEIWQSLSRIVFHDYNFTKSHILVFQRGIETSTHLCWLLAAVSCQSSMFCTPDLIGICMCLISRHWKSLLLLLSSHFSFVCLHLSQVPTALTFILELAFYALPLGTGSTCAPTVQSCHSWTYRKVPHFQHPKHFLCSPFSTLVCCWLRHLFKTDSRLLSTFSAATVVPACVIKKFSHESSRKVWASNDVTMEFVEIVVLHYPWHFMWLVTWFELSLCREDVFIWVNTSSEGHQDKLRRKFHTLNIASEK